MPLRVSAIGFVLLIALSCLLPGVGPRSASAHPLDQLKQHLSVELNSTQIHLTTAIGGGILANELVLSQLDPNADKTISPAEEQAWLDRWLKTFSLSLDGSVVPVPAADIAVSLPPVDDFHFGLTPILLTFTVPLPETGPAANHLLAVHNDYLINRTSYTLNTVAHSGTEVIDESWPDSSIRIAFNADPSVTSTGNDTATQAAEEWSGNKVLKKARELLEHDRTPAFILTLLGIFAFMGALHAMQPGHGKTLVAAYLVATGGTPRDALALAAIVTFTHTISVYVLGLATLAASQVFLPSKVIPVMGVISGLIVAAMGFSMLRNAINRRRNRPHLREDAAFENHMHSHATTDDHHHHDHATLSDDEHARLHAQEAMIIRQGVTRRNLITLGVSGGLAPCPDALAILLLSIGMNQAGLGMIAIVAFSFGLAAVLVAFGLAVALIGPAWNRARSGAETGHSRFGTAFTRFAAVAPLVSASIVLLLGLAMAWRSMISG